MQHGKAFYDTYEETYFKMTTYEWVEVAELQSTQEESDTSLLNNWFEGSHSHSRRHRCHVALFCFPKGYPLPHLSYVCDTEPHAICRHQQTGLAIGRHHLRQPNSATCCDTVSTFASRGKLSALKLTKRSITYQETFCRVGPSWDVQPQLFEKAQQVVCMWLLASNTTEVNDLRYQPFCAKMGEIESSLLPPCIDCLFMHLLRANYRQQSGSFELGDINDDIDEQFYVLLLCLTLMFGHCV